MSPADWLRRFSWDEARYPPRRPLREVVDRAVGAAAAVEEDLRRRAAEAAQAAQRAAALSRAADQTAAGASGASVEAALRSMRARGERLVPPLRGGGGGGGWFGAATALAPDGPGAGPGAGRDAAGRPADHVSTDHLVALYVVVPRGAPETSFLAEYEQLLPATLGASSVSSSSGGPPPGGGGLGGGAAGSGGFTGVVPGSAAEAGTRDDRSAGLWQVLVFRAVAAEWETRARAKGWRVRPPPAAETPSGNAEGGGDGGDGGGAGADPDPDPDAPPGEGPGARADRARAALARRADADRRWVEMTAHPEALSAWAHLALVRLFVEGVLRYGLPPRLRAALVRPRPGRAARARAALEGAFRGHHRGHAAGGAGDHWGAGQLGGGGVPGGHEDHGGDHVYVSIAASAVA